MSGGEETSTWVGFGLQRSTNSVKYSKETDIESQWSHLIVNLKFLHHSQLHKHSQSGRYHGVNIQREIVKGELIDAQLANEGNVSSLFYRGGRKTLRRK